MKALEKEIDSFIKKASIRIGVNFLIRNLIIALNIALGISIFVIVLSLFFPIPFRCELAYGSIIVLVMLSIGYSFIRRYRKKQVALIVDSKGLKERVTTYLELKGREDDFAKAQREDTLVAIREFNIKDKLPIKFPKKEILLAVSLTVVCISMSFINTSATEKGNKIKELNKIKKDMIEEIKKEEKKIDDMKNLTEEEKKELKDVLDKAKEQIKESDKKEELNKANERLEKKLDTLQDKLKSEDGKKDIDKIKDNLLKEAKENMKKEAQKDENAVKNNLMKTEEGKKLLEALETGDKEKIAEAVSSLNKSLDSLSDVEKSKLSNSFSEAAASVNSDELKEALNSAADGVMDGNINEKDLAGALASMKSKSSGSNKSESGNGSGSGNGEGNGGGNGSGNGEGNGGGNGSGNGSGSGTGSGWNTGSKNGTEKVDTTKSSEEIYIPGREVGSDSNLSGGKNEDGNTQSFTTKNGINTSGSKDNYTKYVEDYSDEALNNLDSSSMPDSLKGVVKDYFEGLK